MAATAKVRCSSCRKQAEIVAPKRSELPVLWECPHCDERNTLTDGEG
jgi:ribosomal protein L37AE/L43A